MANFVVHQFQTQDEAPKQFDAGLFRYRWGFPVRREIEKGPSQVPIQGVVPDPIAVCTKAIVA